jgi:tight adherence protein C
MVVLFLIGLVCLGGAVFLAGDVATADARERRGSVRRAASYGRRGAVDRVREPLRQRTLDPLKQRLAEGALRLTPKATVESVTFRLLSAGLGRRVSPTGFLAAKAVLALSGLFFGALLGGAAAGAGTAIGFAVVFGGGGFVAPDFVVGSRARRRRERMRAELPDALDLLAVSVEAGLGFDGAIAKLTEQSEGPLAEEFALTLSEMRIGESRSEALKKLADRAATPEIAAFVRAIMQADQFGISLGRILRVQATDTRLRRQAAAEERAMKAPIKMLFPTVAFIFPALFLVILGPAFLSLSQLLGR